MTWEWRRPSSRMRAYMVRSSFSVAGWGSDHGPGSGSVAAAGAGSGFFLSAAKSGSVASRMSAGMRRERASMRAVSSGSEAAREIRGKGEDSRTELRAQSSELRQSRTELRAQSSELRQSARAAHDSHICQSRADVESPARGERGAVSERLLERNF